MPERREGFTYIYSDVLKQEVAVSHKTGWVYCQDKGPDGSLVAYSPEELNVLEKAGFQLDLGTHNIKKIIGGKIVGHNGKPELENKGKPDAGAPPDDPANDQNPGGGAPGAGGNVTANRDGELDIY